jgi:cytochrome c5
MGPASLESGRRSNRPEIKMSRTTFAACTGAAAVCYLMAVSAAEAPRTGAQVYETYCAVCHSSGWQEAPIANDVGEWTDRFKKGADAVFKNVRDGVSAMPPMGTCMDCTDGELRAAIAEMTRR